MNTAFASRLDDYIAEHRYRLINSVLVYENDELVFERYYNKFTPDSRDNIKSIWKSILSLTLGICLDRGLVGGLDEPVCRYLAPFNEDIHPYHKRLTLRHLLTMSSGIYWNGGVHYHCPMFEQLLRSRDWVSHIADVQMKALPGSFFQYKEWDAALISAVIGKAAGVPAYEICREFLYEPLEIQSGVWPISKCGVNYNVMQGEERSDLSARDLAKIGRLMLRGGEWNGRRIVSNDYIKSAAAPSDAAAGYGLMWWIFESGFGGSGFGGQDLNVYPARNAVAVIQATPTPSSKFYGDVLAGMMDAYG
ncbi:MAG: beta-lactamase family protein [Oscillospiraceae bacterium]|jgi:CubicO group peptidase (beta-lactamase class C family)|nr:beta-lactamase family protein [Oscillospiraceae bacterium]